MINTSNTKSAILNVTPIMSAKPQPELETVNALDLAARMGIRPETISRAIGVDGTSLSANPRDQRWQPQLRNVAELWEQLTTAFGGEPNARAFLLEQRPELRGKTPVHYLEEGRPNVVRNLVSAMQESLP